MSDAVEEHDEEALGYIQEYGNFIGTNSLVAGPEDSSLSVSKPSTVHDYEHAYNLPTRSPISSLVSQMEAFQQFSPAGFSIHFLCLRLSYQSDPSLISPIFCHVSLLYN